MILAFVADSNSMTLGSTTTSGNGMTYAAPSAALPPPAPIVVPARTSSTTASLYNEIYVDSRHPPFEPLKKMQGKVTE